MKLRQFFLLAGLITGLLSGAQNSSDSAWIIQNYTKTEVMISMRDGVKLFTAIYRPKDSTEMHPVLMVRTPYSCAPYGEKQFRKLWNSYHKAYCYSKYILVYQDVRGRFKSEGEFEDVRPFNPNKKTNKDVDEASDTYDGIDWIVKNVRTNGKVGVMGISYPGFYSTMAALSNHPALKAVSPQAPVTDWFAGDDFHHNGAFMMMDAFEFYAGFGVPRPKPSETYNKGFRRKEADAYQFYLDAGPLSNLSRNYLADSIPFWNDLMKHPNYDAWWQARNPRNFVKNIQPAMLIVGGLFDAEDCFGAWNLYKAIEKNNPGNLYNKLVMGPWSHGGWEGRYDGSYLGKVKFGSPTSAWYQQHFEIPFFRFYLEGKGSLDEIKEANVFVSGENKWHAFDVWPPAKVQYNPIYLQAGQHLSFWHPRPLGYREKPDSAMGWSEFTSDPARPVPHEGDTIKSRTAVYMVADQRFASQRPDVLSFTSDTLMESVLLAGPVVADLMVSISGTDADFIIKLVDVFPDDMMQRDTAYQNEATMNGYEMLVRGEILRGKFRNSLEKPEPFVANKITRVKFTLPDVAHQFLKGHRIMVQIQASWFPLADRNPQKFTDIYHATAADFQTATIRIYHTEGIASKLILPVLK